MLRYGSESWVMYPQISKALGGFNHRVIHILIGMMPQQNEDGIWTYPPLVESMVEAGL